jgi:hypothetical protein
MSRQVSLVDQPLLLPRKDVAALLNCSYHQVILLEEAGTLKAVRLSPGPKAKAYFRRSDILALIERDAPCFSNERKNKAKKEQAEA